MARTPVYATNPNHLDVLGNEVPDTPIQALMETAPFQEPVLSKQELLPVMDAAVAALEILDERDQWIIYARIWRRMSVRQVAAELALSKTHVDRLFKDALARLADHLRSTGDASDIARVLGRVDL